MKSYVLLKVGDTDYRLRISTSAAIELEDKLNCSVVDGLNRMTEMRVLSKYIYAAARQLNDNIKSEGDALDLIDEYTMQGNNIESLFDVMLDVMECSGYIKHEAVELTRDMSKKITAQLHEKAKSLS